jgi:GNAT superfamily N-acetyltransferase
MAQGDVTGDRVPKHIPTSADLSEFKKSVIEKYNKKFSEGLEFTEKLQEVKAIVADGAYSTEVSPEDEWQRTWPDMEVTMAEYVDGAYNFTDEQSGLEARVEQVGIDGDGQVLIQGYVYDAEDNQVGKFKRDLNPDDKMVHNAYFKLNEEYRGSGFGRRYYQHQEDAAMIAGFEKIEINANIDVGGYAWARMGYSFDPNQDSAEEIGSMMLENWQSEFPDDDFPLPDFSEAYELALVESPDGEPWGKQQMLGSDWYAVKPLDVNDLGFLAGQLYYESKE